MIVEKNNIVINKRKGLLLLVIALLCSTSMYAQDITIQKPTKNTPTQTAPATKSNSSIANKSSNNSSTTNSSSQSSTSKPTSGYINGYEYVDLGLSVKWATCNMGASDPSDYGNYYAWGETKPKLEYIEANSNTYSKNMSDIAGSGTFDAARANWGSTWRLPTASEIDELVNKCTCIWTTQGGHNGYKITSSNGNSIFLPATGYYDGATLNVVNVGGFYWSATPYYGDATGCSYYLLFNREKLFRDWVVRIYGLTIRPVSK